MKLDLGTRASRQDILRGVYEDNLRIVNKRVEAARGRSRRARWGLRATLLLAGVLVAAAGFQVWQEIQAKHPAEAGALAAVADPEAAAERMAREFGSPDDPGLAAEVPIANLFDLQVRTIVIDPGHGGEDPGALGPQGTREKDVTLDVARRLRRRLERRGLRVLMTREDDRKVSLRRRVAFANEHEADLFISLHVNALPAEGVTSVETYYFGLQADAQAMHLARLENQDSDFSMADFRESLEKIGDTMKFQESKLLASSIQRTLYRNMRRVNSQVSDWGVRRGPFVVLLGVQVPSVLAEMAVISNRAEEAKLNTPQHREHLAMSLEAGILGYLHPDTSESTQRATEHGSQKDP